MQAEEYWVAECRWTLRSDEAQYVDFQLRIQVNLSGVEYYALHSAFFVESDAWWNTSRPSVDAHEHTVACCGHAPPAP